MAKQKMDLAGIFQAVTQSLAENQHTLDQADDYNHNHGSNMVQTFQTVTNALEKKRDASDSAALAYAAKAVAKQANSGSSQLYAQNLAQAATHFKGKRVDERGALDLLQTLIGGQSSGGGGGDLLGALLGGMSGTSGGSASQQQGAAQQGAAQQGGLNLGNLLQGALAYMQASQGGASTMEALVQAFVAGSGMGNSRHRTESTQVVVNSFLQALGGMNAQRAQSR